MKVLKTIGRWVFTVLGFVWVFQGGSALINHGKDELTGITTSMGGAWSNLILGLFVLIWPITTFVMALKATINHKQL